MWNRMRDNFRPMSLQIIWRPLKRPIGFCQVENLVREADSFQLQPIPLQLAFEYCNFSVLVLNLLQEDIYLVAVHFQVPGLGVQFLGQMNNNIHQVFYHHCFGGLVRFHWLDTVSHVGCQQTGDYLNVKAYIYSFRCSIETCTLFIGPAISEYLFWERLQLHHIFSIFVCINP